MTTTSDDGIRRILGLPISAAGLSDANARLRAFEPENPNLFVPRTFGIGWDLNIGAVAVRLGLLRPDDSVPDLADHIPPATTAVLRAGPVVGAAGVALAGMCVARRYDRLPTNWGVTLRPTRWGGPVAALAAPVLISAGAGVWAEVAARRLSRPAATPTIEVTASAQALGLQTMSLLLIAAAARQADNPQATRLLPAAALLAAPAVATGVLVTTVRGALRRLDRKLRNSRTDAAPR